MSKVQTLRLKDDIPLKRGRKTTVFVTTDNNIVYVDEKTRSGNLKMDNPTILEINTNIPTAILSKKAKCGIFLCVSVSVLSVTLSMALAYHHCVNMSSLKNQVEIIMMKMENMSSQRAIQETLFSKSQEEIRSFRSEALSWHPPENNEINQETVKQNITVHQQDFFVVHFQGAQPEVNLGLETKTGPWMLDAKISSPNSHTKVELVDTSFLVKESGLYLIYAQVVYLTHDPCCYFVWAQQRGSSPRLLTTCATGSDASGRALSKSQISCAAQTVARLNANDLISIVQREHNRTMWMRPGYSYFGLIKLGS